MPPFAVLLFCVMPSEMEWFCVWNVLVWNQFSVGQIKKLWARKAECIFCIFRTVPFIYTHTEHTEIYDMIVELNFFMK